MRVPLALLADYANVTAEGKLNIMGIFDAIYAGAFPATHPQMRLIMRFQFAAGDRGTTKNIQIRLLDADGNALLALGSTVVVPQNAPLNLEIPQIIELNGLQFPKQGDYAFSILVNDEERATVPFRVLPINALPAPNQSNQQGT
jgi:hypothetical protein